MTAAARMRLVRKRAREGRCVVQIEVDEDDIEVLCAARLLTRMVDHSRQDIAGAIQKLLKDIAKQIVVTRHDAPFPDEL